MSAPHSDARVSLGTGTSAAPSAAAITPDGQPKPRSIDEREAVEIWIARWLRVPVKSLIERYGCDSSRLYEIWWSERFPASRGKAEAEFRRRYPERADRTSYGYRRIPRRPSAPEGQLALFE